jgi:AraC-like DNA-binding protein
MYHIHLSLKDLQKVHHAARIISEKLEHHYTIPELAELVDIPEKKLKAGFRHLFNTGAFRYRYSLIWNKVKTLLLQDKSLKSIAEETGFRDKNALIKSFKNEFGVTPHQWRQEQQNNLIQ